MGAFMCFDISFKEKKDRIKFEKKFPHLTKNILVGEKSNSGGFVAWQMMRNPNLDVIYFMGFLGYGDPMEIVRICKVDKINIKFLSWMPINDRFKDRKWEKLVGRW